MQITDHNPLSCIALIPARSGSKRIPEKNIRYLGGHPLLAYTIHSAIESEIFSSVIVSTDSYDYANIARHYGAEVPFLRPKEYAEDTSPDIDWIHYTLQKLSEDGREFNCFSILRPTSPFRQAKTIQRAWDKFICEKNVDSLRAVEKCSQHPGKMWVIRGNKMYPLLPYGSDKQPWHSSPTQSLPDIYVQNASLEIAWTRIVMEKGSIAGEVIIPFFTEGYEGFDLNNPTDWQVAEELIKSGKATLPDVRQHQYIQ